MSEDRYKRSTLEIPPLEVYLESVSDFILSFARQLEFEEERGKQLRQATFLALSMILKCHATGKSDERIKIEAYESDGRLYVEMLNLGVPIFIEGHEAKSWFQDASRGMDEFNIRNLGRSGQTVVIVMRLGEHALKKLFNVESLKDEISEEEQNQIVIREIGSGEEKNLSELFYHVYGYHYVHDFVYFPEKLREMLDNKKLVSFVASLPDGRLLGHVGLRRWNQDPMIYEPCLGVIHPSIKSRGLFSAIFKQMMEWVNHNPMQFCFFDFVTNHEFSQKLVGHYNPSPLALFVGCQVKETQASLERLGLGEDPKQTDRYSLLFSILPRVEYPFGQSVFLPNNLGEMLGFLLRPLNLYWSPAPRFEMLPSIGEYQTQVQPLQHAVLFDLIKPGRESVQKILSEWRQLLKAGYQYAGVEVSLDSPGIGQLYDMLSEAGFFVAGFIPFHCTPRLGLRFQALGPTKLDFSEIKVHGEESKKLLGVIRENYERNQEQ